MQAVFHTNDTFTCTMEGIKGMNNIYFFFVPLSISHSFCGEEQQEKREKTDGKSSKGTVTVFFYVLVLNKE